MFDRYTEKARRVIFFARYEASQFGSPYIETEHILLGILREGKRLTNRLFKTHATVESIRKQIESHTVIREKVSTSVDLPLSNESKRVLAFAAEEADALGDKQIDPKHLMLGLLREEASFAAIMLKKSGIRLEDVRVEADNEPPAPSSVSIAAKSPSGAFRDLTQAALDGTLEALIGRQLELDSIVEVFCSRRRRNVLLLGDRGVGKTAIVHGLARRIAEGTVPAPLLGTGLLSIEPDLLVSWARDRHFEGLFKLLGSTPTPEKMILFLDGAEGFLASTLKSGAQNPGIIIRAALQAGVRCIGTGSAAEYRTASETSPWLNAFFRPVFVQPMDQTETLLVAQARKGELEKFHEVVFSDEALAFAALWSGCLPGKALELLDAAGARARLRQVVIPEIAEVQKRLNFITKKEEDSLSNHEFEKARFFSDEARKERESLQALRERHRLSENAVRVAKQDLEDVIASWSQYPYSA